MLNYQKVAFSPGARSRHDLSLPEFTLVSLVAVACAITALRVRVYAPYSLLRSLPSLAISRLSFKKLLVNNPYLTVALSLTSFVIRSVFASVLEAPCASLFRASFMFFFSCPITNLHSRAPR